VKSAPQRTSVKSQEFPNGSSDNSKADALNEISTVSRKQVPLKSNTLSLYQRNAIPSRAPEKEDSKDVKSMAQKFRSEGQFFESLVTESRDVWIYLLNGIKLSGRLMNSLESCVLLKSSGAQGTLDNTQLIFKNAISTVAPQPMRRRRNVTLAPSQSVGAVVE